MIVLEQSLFSVSAYELLSNGPINYPDNHLQDKPRPITRCAYAPRGKTTPPNAQCQDETVSNTALHPTNRPELFVPPLALASASFCLWISAIHLLIRFSSISEILPSSDIFDGDRNVKSTEGRLRLPHGPYFLIRQLSLRVVDPAAAFRLMNELCFIIVRLFFIRKMCKVDRSALPIC